MKTKILIIDDDPDIGNMIRLLLQYKGYEVSVIQNPQEAKNLGRNDHFDLMIMDMLLSGTNGVDLCAAFKKDPDLAAIPIIMMSAHPDAQKICVGAGANDFISKPFEMNDLLQKISNLLTKSHNTVK